MLAGERLFAGGSETDVIAKLLKRDIRRPSELTEGISPALDAVVMRGLAHDPDERFPTARDLCVALAGCGLQEATGLAVGEWVEGLAEEALAERSARVAAIESQSDTDPRAVEHHASTPPQSQPPATPSHSPSMPTVTAPRLSPVTATAIVEAPPEVTGVAMIASMIPRVRARVLGVGTAVALGVVAIVVAMTRGGSHEQEHASAVVAHGPLPQSAALAASPAPVAAAVAPDPAPVAPAPSPAAAPIASPLPVATAASAPVQRPTPVGPRPSRAALPTKGPARDSVFDSRE